MITFLQLKNWRTHKDTLLEFGGGTNVIVGVMGSGKSSVVNAISYALFGTFPSLKNKSVTLKETIMNKPNQEGVAEVILGIAHGEKTLTIERTIKADGTNEAKLYEEKRLIAGPKQKDVNEKVEALLGMNYELFSRAVYAEQNEMDFFLKLSPGDRKKKFDELLELEKYEEARKNAISLQNELLKEGKQKKDFIERQKESIKQSDEEKVLAQIKAEEKAIKEFEEELFAAKKTGAEQEQKYKNLAEKEAKHKEIEEQLLRNSSRAEGLREDIAKGEKVSAKEIEEKVKENKKTAAEKEQKLERKEKEVKEADKALKKASEELKVLEYKREEVLGEEKGVSSLKGKCPTCKRELDEKHKKEILAEAKTKLAKISAEMEEKEKERRKLLDTFGALEKEKELLRKENEKIGKELSSLEELLKRACEVEGKKKALAELLEKEPKLKKGLAELGFDKKHLEKAREEYFNGKTKISVAESQIKSKKELKKSFESNLEKIKELRKNISESEKEIEKTEGAAKKLGIFANCLVATQGELRGELLETINQAMSTIWETIYPYKDFKDARLCVVTEGYDLQVLTRNNEGVRVEGILSGGERSAAALCIRIAFALVLTKKLSMLILDEPTHNLDSNAVQKLSEMLRDELPKLVSQVFVITHDKQLENAASSNLYLLTRNKNLDESTRVEMLAVE